MFLLSFRSRRKLLHHLLYYDALNFDFISHLQYLQKSSVSSPLTGIGHFLNRSSFNPSLRNFCPYCLNFPITIIVDVNTSHPSIKAQTQLKVKEVQQIIERVICRYWGSADCLTHRHRVLASGLILVRYASEVVNTSQRSYCAARYC